MTNLGPMAPYRIARQADAQFGTIFYIEQRPFDARNLHHETLEILFGVRPDSDPQFFDLKVGGRNFIVQMRQKKTQAELMQGFDLSEVDKIIENSTSANNEIKDTDLRRYLVDLMNLSVGFIRTDTLRSRYSIDFYFDSDQMTFTINS